jgi:pantoate--beta-alanine ligase
MKIIKTIKVLRRDLAVSRHKNKTIGFVPTMGYFHDGHLELMRRCARENDVTIVSLFVNPLQFGPHEDLNRYPRDIKRDAALANSSGVDVLFVPPVGEMYPELVHSYIEVGKIGAMLCGASRPGHFRGVATVVAKLLNVVQPDIMYLGQKDAQQVAVIKKMVQDLNIPVKVAVCPTRREPDGLAMSSRNVYLSPSERQQAPVLFEALSAAGRKIASGERDGNKIISEIKLLLKKKTSARIDYVFIVDRETFVPTKIIERDCVIALAVWFSKARLIDNLVVRINAKI